MASSDHLWHRVVVPRAWHQELSLLHQVLLLISLTSEFQEMRGRVQQFHFRALPAALMAREDHLYPDRSDLVQSAQAEQRGQTFL